MEIIIFYCLSSRFAIRASFTLPPLQLCIHERCIYTYTLTRVCGVGLWVAQRWHANNAHRQTFTHIYNSDNHDNNNTIISERWEIYIIFYLIPTTSFQQNSPPSSLRCFSLFLSLTHTLVEPFGSSDQNEKRENILIIIKYFPCHLRPCHVRFVYVYECARRSFYEPKFLKQTSQE